MKNFKNYSRNILVLAFFAVSFLAQSFTPAFADVPYIPLDADPLQQLNRMKDLKQQQMLEENLQKDLQEYDKKAVDDNEVDKASKAKGTDLKFNIKEVQFTESTVLKKTELDKVASEYIGKEVTLDQLYQMVNEVNEVYRKKGYTVCRAFLPEQTIKDGIARVTLVEGKTGKIVLDNVRFTRKNYVISRTGLKHGRVNNLKDLNRRISLFNATNDAQVSVKLAAGEEQGTTDYILTLDEPACHTVYVTADNTGSDSTGTFRYGLGWTMYSLLGIRDTLSLTYMRSSDFNTIGVSNSGGVSYSFPITKVGTKISTSVFGNAMDMGGFAQELQKFDPHGDSVSYSLSLSQPFCVTAKLRIVGDFSWSKQYSDSRFRLAKDELIRYWKDDTTTKYSGGLAFTHFGRGVVWYHRYSATKAHSITKYDTTDYWLWNFNFVRQQAFMNGNSFTTKINAQYVPNLTGEHTYDVNSSDFFYLGGVGSVRGYQESILGGEHGFSVNLEYAVPFRNYRNLTPIFFLDYGKVYGPSSFDDTQLASTGLGLRWYNKNGKLSGTVWLGIPLIKDANGSKVDGARIHINLYGEFEDLLSSIFSSKKVENEETTVETTKEPEKENPEKE